MAKQSKTKTGRVWKILGKVLTVFVVIFATLAVLLARSCQWMLQTWTGLTMEELVYHLGTNLGGTSNDMIWEYIRFCVIISVIVCAFLIIFFVVFRKRKLLYRAMLSGVMVLSITVIAISVHNVWTTLDVSAYANNRSEYSTYIDDNYVDPRDVTLTFPQEKRNLIYIYLESMENTFSNIGNGGAFEFNTIPELTELSEENENFSGTQGGLNGGYPMPGATWTIGAMFAQSTGLPLSIPIDQQNEMNKQEHFLPDVVAIGDILENAGYNQTLMIGSSAEFGGRSLFYQEHGDYEICDYFYAVALGLIPSDYYVWWGYEDDKLFDYAKTKLEQLAEEDEPFNFTMLTADTHFEDGYTCEDCPDTFGDNVYANVMACSSKKVSEFVAWIQQQDFYENTTIVISGDHLTMDSDFCNDVPEDYTRKVYTTYIHSAVESQTDYYRTYTTFDNFPTTLASLGVEIEGNRLGLGTNLFSDQQTLTEIYGYETEAQEVAKRSELMDELTSDLKSSEEIQIEEAQEAAEQQEEETQTVSADVSVTAYDYHTGKFSVNISNIQSLSDIQAIRCAVWPEDDQSQMIWYEGAQNEDGSYTINVKAADFGFERGYYNVHVYAVDLSGNPILIGGTGQTI